MRQRRTGPPAASGAVIPDEAAIAAAAASGTSLLHAHQGRAASSSSAHICSNQASCPLIARWQAAPPAERDTIPLSEELLVCSACRSKLYCSRDCQRMDWLAGHKQECAKLAVKQHENGSSDASGGASTVAAAAGRSSVAAATSPAHAQPHHPPHRHFNLNIALSFGPRGVFAICLVLYLIYRTLYRSKSAADPASSLDAPAVG